MTHDLNRRASRLVKRIIDSAGDLRIRVHEMPGGGRVIDCGVDAAGGLAAGLDLARVCMAGLGEVALVPGEIGGVPCPAVQVTTDHPVAACLWSQYAGWKIAVGEFFAMGSGPVRAAVASEELFARLGYSERPEACVGVLEGSNLPDEDVLRYVAEKSGVPAERVTLLIARTASQAGNVQVVARSVETALHKLFELGFDVGRVENAYGIAPLPPVAKDDLAGVGRTNDAILYGARVTLWVRGDDESLAEIGPRVPSSSSESHGRPFLELFAEANHDFYALDPHLFSPAEVTFQNLDTGRVQRFGRIEPEILRQSFGL
ncbi:MAG: methenyltetrahydromethanopterin cyclohydrolase [Planctomycetales bacterium]